MGHKPESGEQPINVGYIRADNPDDINPDSVGLGFVVGEGLISKIWLAGLEIEEVAMGYAEGGRTWHELKEARIKFFGALKAIETAVRC